MQAVRPLVRTVAVSSASRIPHLEFHIIRRNVKRVQQSDDTQPVSRCQSRSRSTIAPSISFNPIELVTQPPHDDTSTASRVYGTSSADVEDVNTNITRTTVQKVVDCGNPRLILDTLLDEEIGTPLLRFASDEIFDEALLKIDPEYLLEPYRSVYRFVSKDTRGRNTEMLPTVKQLLQSHYRKLDQIITTRMDAGFNLSLDACRHLLKWASSLGDKAMAEQVMEIIHSTPGLEPDLECYNSLMRACNWNQAYTPEERFHMRVLPTHLEFRGQNRDYGAFSGHSVRNPQLDIGGVRQDNLDVFKSLTEHGFQANESTFINLMTAMGREGDMAGVKSILKSVWNIDVDMLHVYDEDELESPTFYEEDSPLRPSQKLLYTMAHTFGSNNEAATAFLLVDYVSRNYNLKISDGVWQELLEWYMILSLPRSNTPKHQEQMTGKISPEAVNQLFAVMEDQPHNVKPNGFMYAMLARSEQGRNRLEEQLLAMRNMRRCADQIQNELFALHQELQTREKERSDAEGETAFYAVRDKFYLALIEREALQGLLSKTLFRMLNNQELTRKVFPTVEQWERQIIPDIADEFAEYMPGRLRYRTATGTVNIEFLPHQKQLRKELYGRFVPWMYQFYSVREPIPDPSERADKNWSGQVFKPFSSKAT